MRRIASVLAGSLVVVGVLAAAGGGCTYDWTYVEPAADGGRDGRADGGAGEKPPPEPDPKPDSGEPPPPPPPDPATPCKEAKGCPPDRYCLFPDGQCGRGQVGQCMPVDACVKVVSTSKCACDGVLRGGPCEAAKNAFVDVDNAGVACGGGEKPFSCPGSPTDCKRGVEYCVYGSTGVGKCAPVPPECKDAGCACAKIVGPSCTCSDVEGKDAVSVKCP